LNKNRIAVAIALFLMLTMGFSLVALPVANAQEIPEEIPTYLLINAAPSLVGVGQPVYINVFMSKPPVTAGLGGSGDMYKDITIDVVHPDGTKETLGSFTTDATGGVHVPVFVPAKTGNYTFQASYPGQHIEGWTYPFMAPPAYVNVTYSASTSQKVTLTVQAEPIPTYSSPPLPTEYWSRPIYSTNYAWAQLGGNWLGLAPAIFATTGQYDATGNFQPDCTAPNTGHIMWTKPTHFGGQVGGPITADQMSQYMSTTIASNYFEPIVLNGILYYTHFAGPTAEKASWVAVDLRTGETLWTRTAGESGNEVFRMGQVLRWHSIQEYGSWAFLYSCPSAGFFQVANYFSIYDPMTGTYLANITDIQNVPFLMDLKSEQQGTLLGYYTDGGNLTMWNSTKLMMSHSFDQITIRPTGTYNWSEGIQWSVPLPTAIGTATIDGPLSIAARTPEVILLRYSPSPGMFVSLSYGYQITVGYNATTGKLLWGPKNQTIPNLQDISLLAAKDGVYVLHNKDTDEAYGYSLMTGDMLWGPVKLPGNAYSHIMLSAQIAYGTVFIWDFGGYVNALNATTGKILWTFPPQSAGYNTPYGVYPLWYTGSVCDGKLFLSESKMYDPPLFPGGQRLVINCTTGKLVWSILSFSGRVPAAHADGYMVEWNSYDSQIYTYGKGPTATTVTAPDTVQPLGTQVLVQGTVMDQSAGTKDSDRTARFPNGVPAVSDQDMSPWMEYVYMQQPKPTNATGVKVTVSVLDPNNNCYDVGTTTSDASGFFKLSFTPQVPGEYTVIASFAGSDSYYSSSAETALAVNEAPAATPAPTPSPASLADIYFLPATIGIIVAIAVVGAVIVLMLRKR
jgi:hypothetical protein